MLIIPLNVSMPGRLHAIQQRTIIKHVFVALIFLKYRISLIAAFISCPSVFIDSSSRQYDTTNSYIYTKIVCARKIREDEPRAM